MYQDAIPRLAKALLAARGLAHPSAEQLAETYQMALLLLFRLLFVAYAEDRDLLPYRTNGLYETRSLKHKATELAELARKTPSVAASPSSSTAAMTDEMFRFSPVTASVTR